MTGILDQSNSLSSFEIYFLLDKKEVFDTNKLKVKINIEFHKTEDKLKFLIKRFVKPFNFNLSKEWFDFLEFKDFRNKLVHPRNITDEFEIQDYEKKIKQGLSSIIYFMNILLTGIINKPLRKKLLDLIPE